MIGIGLSRSSQNSMLPSSLSESDMVDSSLGVENLCSIGSDRFEKMSLKEDGTDSPVVIGGPSEIGHLPFPVNQPAGRSLSGFRGYPFATTNHLVDSACSASFSRACDEYDCYSATSLLYPVAVRRKRQDQRPRHVSDLYASLFCSHWVLSSL